tara:strand:+ start:471 stop:677 length:207 start_codon:yes stop_codon:yes gene_type:complete
MEHIRGDKMAMVEPWVSEYLKQLRRENEEDAFQEPRAESLFISEQAISGREVQERYAEEAEEAEEESP